MLDTTFAVTGKQLTCSGKTYTITAAGIRNDQPFATIDPHDDMVLRTIVRHIRNCMPLSFALEDIQRDLA